MIHWKAPVGRGVQGDTEARAVEEPKRAPIFSASRALAAPATAPTPVPPPSGFRPRFDFPALGRSTSSIMSRDGMRSATFIGAHNVDRMPNAGKVRVEAQPLTTDDVQRAEELVAKGAPNSEPTLSLLRRYEDFRAQNPQITSHGVGVLGFCSQQTRNGGIGPGTGRNMAKELLAILRASQETIEGCPLVNAMLLGLEREYAELGAKHAIDITETEALDFLSRVIRLDVRAALWLLLTCGARVADLLRLEDEQLILDVVARRLRVVFKVTKNRTTVSEKYDVSFPFMSSPDAEVVAFLNSGRQLPNCDSINHVLKKGKFKSVGVRNITTYSFRRVFEHRIIEWYTDEDGITEWTKVIAWTQHQDDKALKGHYNKVTVLKTPKLKVAPPAVPDVSLPPVATEIAAQAPAPEASNEGSAEHAAAPVLVPQVIQAPHAEPTDPRPKPVEKRPRTDSGPKKKPLVQTNVKQYFKKV